MRRAPLLLLVLSLLAGCAEPEPPAAADAAPPPVADAAPLAGADADEPEPEEPAAPTARTLHLGADGSLADEAPAAGMLTMGGSYARCFAEPVCPHLVFESAPLPRDVVLGPQTVMVSLWLQADAPIPPGVFGHAAWFGSSLAMPLTDILESEPVMPGAPTLVEIPLAIEAAPVVVPAGATFRLYVISGTMHEQSGALKLLTGGETPSAVTFTAAETTLPAPGVPDVQGVAGELPAGSFPDGRVVPEDKRSARHAFTIPAGNVSRVLVELRLTGSATGGGDLDMDVLLGETLLAGGHTPHGAEAVFLAGPSAQALAGKDITVVVGNFHAPLATYEVVVTTS